MVAGVRRQRVELLLPQAGGADSEAAGWPGGIRQQFAAARGMVEDALRQLKQTEGLQVGLCNGVGSTTHRALFPSSLPAAHGWSRTRCTS